jgi:DNA-binding LacI/PurR family transcriptional regulator
VVDEPRLDGHPFVGIDDRAGARLAAEHLIALGHRRFAFLTDGTRDDGYAGPLTPEREATIAYVVNRERLNGYREVLEAAGVEWAGVAKHETELNLIEQGVEAGRAVLAGDPRPTAVLATTDQLAFGVLEAARERGLSVPDDLSVIGFDDVPGAAWSRPGLTTVRQPLLEKGEIAGRMLIEERPEREVILPVELIVRGSTAPGPR